MQTALVKFLDPTTFGHWATMDEVDESHCRVCYAAGFLIEENKEVVKVALLTTACKDTCSSWVTIPAACVLEMVYLKEVDWDGQE